jgi:hypothetical protein
MFSWQFHSLHHWFQLHAHEPTWCIDILIGLSNISHFLLKKLLEFSRNKLLFEKKWSPFMLYLSHGNLPHIGCNHKIPTCSRRALSKHWCHRLPISYLMLEFMNRYLPSLTTYFSSTGVMWIDLKSSWGGVCNPNSLPLIDVHQLATPPSLSSC